MFCQPGSALRLTLALALALASCGVEDRELVFGYGQGSSNAVSAGAANGGAVSQSGGEPGEGGAPTANSAGEGPGGEPADDLGGDAGTAGNTTRGGNAAGGTTAGGNAAGGTTAGSSGSSNNGGNGGSAGSGGTVAGTAGGGTTSVDDGPCGDIDHNGVQDCDETLAQNPRFDTTAQSWLADPNVTQTWKSDDARGKAGSGSLAVGFTTSTTSGGWALAAAGQCLPAWGEDSYEVGARARVASGQSAGQAQLSVAFFGNDACQGSLLGSKLAGSATQVGAWQVLHAALKMPAGTRSVLLRLAASKPGSQSSVEVQFDDVLFRKK